MGPLEMLLMAFGIIFGPVGIAIVCLGLIVAPIFGVIWIVEHITGLIRGGE